MQNVLSCFAEPLYICPSAKSSNFIKRIPLCYYPEQGSNPSPFWSLALAQTRFLPPNQKKSKTNPNKSWSLVVVSPKPPIWRRCHHASPPTDPTQPTEIIEHMTFLVIQNIFKTFICLMNILKIYFKMYFF